MPAWFAGKSLSDLSNQLRLSVGPPRLSDLLHVLGVADSVHDFMALVHDYLPEHVLEISACPIDERVAKFVSYFSQRYFPIGEPMFDPEEGLGPFLMNIPVELEGLREDDYHEFENWRNGLQQMMALIQVEDWYRDARIPLVETVSKQVDFSGVPEKGWDSDFIRDAASKDERFLGLKEFVAWFAGDTGLGIMDISYDDNPEIEWCRENVETITDEFRRAAVIHQHIDQMADWLEADPKHFTELVTYLQRIGGE